MEDNSQTGVLVWKCGVKQWRQELNMRNCLASSPDTTPLGISDSLCKAQKFEMPQASASSEKKFVVSKLLKGKIFAFASSFINHTSTELSIDQATLPVTTS